MVVIKGNALWVMYVSNDTNTLRRVIAMYVMGQEAEQQYCEIKSNCTDAVWVMCTDAIRDIYWDIAWDMLALDMCTGNQEVCRGEERGEERGTLLEKRG